MALSVGSSLTADACSCASPQPPEAALEEADAVFLGTIEKFEIEPPVATSPGEGHRIATIRVRRVWRGVQRPVVQVVTALYGGICGYDFIVGDDYLIYASRTKDERLSTGLCSRTRPEHDSGEDLKALGPGTPVVE